MTTDLLHIDGAYGEGGGQIVRTALALAAINGRAVDITDLRAGRSKPGLRPQHLVAVRAAAEICGATVSGDSKSSTALRFAPAHPIRAGNYRFDVGTAGSATLVLQTVLVPLAHADAASHVVVTGGTHQTHAPTADYLEHVYAPALRRAGYNVRVSWDLAGFYPRGGGRVEAWVRPSTPRALDLRRHDPGRDAHAVVVASNLPEHVSTRGVATVRNELGHDVDVDVRNPPSPGPGAAVTVAVTGAAGASGIGRPGKPMEEVARDACQPMADWLVSGAAVDEHLADQLVLPLVLADGTSTYTTTQATEHLRTALWLVDHFQSASSRIDEGPALTSVEIR